MSATVVLAERSSVRYATGSFLYFAQGIPQGLLSIAIPAWLAAQGVGAGEIASYLAVIVLPWAFKLVTGPVMDRFQFPAMGRRRPWVLGAQLGLTLSLLLLGLVEDPGEQIGLLMLLGLLVNSFAATQDVAVDGMAIDLTPVDEQGRLNAFMSFGKAIGWAGTSAVSGVLLVTFGMAVTALVAASVAGLVLLAFVFVLERRGERKLPWTSGEAVSGRHSAASMKAVFSGLNKVLWSRASVVVMGIMAFDGLVTGYGQALMPIAAVRVFGYTTPQWSQLVAVMGLLGAGLALGLGPLIDRFGAKRMLFLTVSLVGAHAFVIAQTQFLWQDTLYVRVMLSVWVLMLPVTMVCVIALAMAVVSSENSATQFAIYMSVANLGHAGGSKLFGLVAEHASYPENYLLLGALVAAMILVIVLHRHRHAEAASLGRHGPSRYAVSTAGAEGGVYWSGAMRCPKCRADMEPVRHGEIEVDRCGRCNGLWFDAGELSALAGSDAAAVIDIGNARTGRKFNQVRDYRCPRCGGEVARISDPAQPHISYETCQSCGGSFFDAGEFRDLSEITLSDFIKRLAIRRPG